MKSLRWKYFFWNHCCWRIDIGKPSNIGPGQSKQKSKKEYVFTVIFKELGTIFESFLLISHYGTWSICQRMWCLKCFLCLKVQAQTSFETFFRKIWSHWKGSFVLQFNDIYRELLWKGSSLIFDGELLRLTGCGEQVRKKLLTIEEIKISLDLTQNFRKQPSKFRFKYC